MPRSTPESLMLLTRWFQRAFVCVVVLSVEATGAFSQTPNEEVERLKRLLVEYVLHNNTGPLDEAARDDFFLVGPGGIESRQHVMATVGNLDADSVSVQNREVRLYGAPTVSSAVLSGTLRAEGTLQRKPMPVLSYLSVYVREGDDWRLAVRSLTPLMVGPQRR